MSEIKNGAEIAYMRQSCRIVHDCLEYLKKLAKPDVKTKYLNFKAEKFISSRGGTPAFKNYKGYPSSICASVNEGVIHGIPGGYKLKAGDILGIDVGVEKAGYFGDAAITIPIGMVSNEKAKLLEVTKEALFLGIEKAISGNHISDISVAIQDYVESYGYSVVRDFCGHGVGKKLHESIKIPNHKTSDKGPKLRPGMTLAIEPMINMGSFEVLIKEDKWSVVTKDGKPSAHFEHTILITDKDPEILTF